MLDAVGVVPVRAGDADARAVLQRDGAVVLAGCGDDPEPLVTAAAQLLGGRLRELFGIRPQGGVDSPALGLHSDGATVTVDVHGRATRLRDPDEDYLSCTAPRPRRPAGTRCSSTATRSSRQCGMHRPGLHAFLTRVDVDFFGAGSARPHSVPLTPLVRGHGRAHPTRPMGRPRRRLHAAGAARTSWDAHLAQLEEYADVLATAQECAARFRLEAGRCSSSTTTASCTDATPSRASAGCTS